MNPREVTNIHERENGLRLAGLHTACVTLASISVMLGAIQVAIGQQIDSQDDATIAGVLRVVNLERTARGLGAVSVNEILQRAAKWMAEDLAASDALDHTDSRHRGLPSRLQAFGYEDPRLLAENVAEGQETPTAVVSS